MASVSDLSLKYRLFLRAYRYRKVDWRPGARLAKPLSHARLALVTTAGFFRPEQAPFDRSIRGGDPSFRILPVDSELDALQIGQKSDAFDPSGLIQDKNLAFPLQRFRELQEEGLIGRLNARHISFMGSITAPGRLIRETAPQAAGILAEDQVDAVFLTPVWPMCHQSVGLIQSLIEKQGIPTVSVTLLKEITREISPPRALFVDEPLGYPLAEPGNPGLQRKIILAALFLLYEGRLPILRAFELA